MKQRYILTNGSRIIIESLVRSGGDVFIGYPITPANFLYLYSTQRFAQTYHAPDEITVVQWMAGISATGKMPVTATSFPGLALMAESINMAYMQELPMIIILAQRLGPSTGTATCGAQGDILFSRGLISGGYTLPVLCISDFNDCWDISYQAMKMSISLRVPVILLTSKEIAMTSRSFNINNLKEIKPIKRHFYTENNPYMPYKPDKNLTPPMLPLSNASMQVRLTASTHDQKGFLQHSTEEALENTKRLEKKIQFNIKDYSFFELDEVNNAKTIILSYGISAIPSREAVKYLRNQGKNVSLLIAKTLFPVLDEYFDILSKYEQIIIVEENPFGQYAEVLFGKKLPKNVKTINSIGKMISAEQIIKGVI